MTITYLVLCYTLDFIKTNEKKALWWKCPGGLEILECAHKILLEWACDLWKARAVSPGDSGLKEESRAGSKDPPKPDYTCNLEKE